VPVTRQTKRALFNQYLAEVRPERLAEAEFHLLRQRLGPISESYLRELLRGCGLPLDPVVEGVRQESLEQLERTLLALAEEYNRALAAEDRQRAASCRRAVLIGRGHAGLVARRKGVPEATRAQKLEMASWMLVWLENPAIFPLWLALRKRV
jgi:hypothetical protein